MQNLHQTLLSLASLLLLCLSVMGQNDTAIDSLRNSLKSLEGEKKNIAILQLVDLYNQQSMYDSVELYLPDVIAEMEETQFHEGLAEAFSFQGSLLWQKYNNYPDALTAFQKSKSLAESVKDSVRIYQASGSIGTIYALMGNYEKALIQYQVASEGATKAGDLGLAIGIYANMSNIHLYTGNKEKRVEYLEKSSDLIKNAKTPIRDEIRMNVRINLADAYIEIGAIDKGKPILDKLQKELQGSPKKIYLGRCLTSLIKIESLNSNYQGVIDYASQIFNLGSMQGYNQMIELSAYAYRAGAYCKTNRREKSIQDINTFKGYLKTVNTNDKVQILEKISELYECNTMIDSAHLYFKEYISLRDSINNEQVSNRIAELEEQFQKGIKEKQISELELQNIQQKNNIQRKNMLIGLLVFFGLMIAGLVYAFYQRKRAKSIEEINQLEQKLLSLQMNPHFIFNSISSIQNFLYSKEDMPTAVTYLSKFAALMRQTLEHSREKYITVEAEIESLTNYLDLQKLRFQNTFDYKISVDPDIEISEAKVPPLIAQPFVENAIEHGQIYNRENGIVNIQIVKKDDSIQFIISDNGIGISSVKIKHQNVEASKKSLATIITQERLAILSKMTKHKFNLLVERNSPEGTTVRIMLPQ